MGDEYTYPGIGDATGFADDAGFPNYDSGEGVVFDAVGGGSGSDPQSELPQKDYDSDDSLYSSDNGGSDVDAIVSGGDTQEDTERGRRMLVEFLVDDMTRSPYTPRISVKSKNTNDLALDLIAFIFACCVTPEELLSDAVSQPVMARMLTATPKWVHVSILGENKPALDGWREYSYLSLASDLLADSSVTDKCALAGAVLPLHTQWSSSGGATLLMHDGGQDHSRSQYDKHKWLSLVVRLSERYEVKFAYPLIGAAARNASTYTVTVARAERPPAVGGPAWGGRGHMPLRRLPIAAELFAAAVKRPIVISGIFGPFDPDNDGRDDTTIARNRVLGVIRDVLKLCGPQPAFGGGFVKDLAPTEADIVASCLECHVHGSGGRASDVAAIVLVSEYGDALLPYILAIKKILSERASTDKLGTVTTSPAALDLPRLKSSITGRTLVHACASSCAPLLLAELCDDGLGGTSVYAAANTKDVFGLVAWQVAALAGGVRVFESVYDVSVDEARAETTRQNIEGKNLPTASTHGAGGRKERYNVTGKDVKGADARQKMAGLVESAKLKLLDLPTATNRRAGPGRDDLPGILRSISSPLNRDQQRPPRVFGPSVSLRPYKAFGGRDTQGSSDNLLAASASVLAVVTWASQQIRVGTVESAFDSVFAALHANTGESAVLAACISDALRSVLVDGLVLSGGIPDSWVVKKWVYGIGGDVARVPYILTRASGLLCTIYNALPPHAELLKVIRSLGGAQVVAYTYAGTEEVLARAMAELSVHWQDATPAPLYLLPRTLPAQERSATYPTAEEKKKKVTNSSVIPRTTKNQRSALEVAEIENKRGAAKKKRKREEDAQTDLSVSDAKANVRKAQAAVKTANDEWNEYMSKAPIDIANRRLNKINTKKTKANGVLGDANLALERAEQKVMDIQNARGVGQPSAKRTVPETRTATDSRPLLGDRLVPTRRRQQRGQCPGAKLLGTLSGVPVVRGPLAACAYFVIESMTLPDPSKEGHVEWAAEVRIPGCSTFFPGAHSRGQAFVGTGSLAGGQRRILVGLPASVVCSQVLSRDVIVVLSLWSHIFDTPTRRMALRKRGEASFSLDELVREGRQLTGVIDAAKTSMLPRPERVFRAVVRVAADVTAAGQGGGIVFSGVDVSGNCDRWHRNDARVAQSAKVELERAMFRRNGLLGEHARGSVRDGLYLLGPRRCLPRWSYFLPVAGVPPSHGTDRLFGHLFRIAYGEMEDEAAAAAGSVESIRTAGRVESSAEDIGEVLGRLLAELLPPPASAQKQKQRMRVGRETPHLTAAVVMGRALGCLNRGRIYVQETTVACELGSSVARLLPDDTADDPAVGGAKDCEDGAIDAVRQFDIFMEAYRTGELVTPAVVAVARLLSEVGYSCAFAGMVVRGAGGKGESGHAVALLLPPFAVRDAPIRPSAAAAPLSKPLVIETTCRYDTESRPTPEHVRVALRDFTTVFSGVHETDAVVDVERDGVCTAYSDTPGYGDDFYVDVYFLHSSALVSSGTGTGYVVQYGRKEAGISFSTLVSPVRGGGGGGGGGGTKNGKSAFVVSVVTTDRTTQEEIKRVRLATTAGYTTICIPPSTDEEGSREAALATDFGVYMEEFMTGINRRYAGTLMSSGTAIGVLDMDVPLPVCSAESAHRITAMIMTANANDIPMAVLTCEYCSIYGKDAWFSVRIGTGGGG